MGNPNAARSLNRLTHHLRGLLKTMAGEETDPFHIFDPHYDEFASVEEHLQELYTLLESATEKNESYPGLEGRQDWVVERECEISRLEKENEDLRRMLGIDEASLNERGITVDVSLLESGRYATFFSSSHRRSTASTDSYSSRLGHWENGNSSGTGNGGGGVGIGQPPTPALQRSIDFQPGMRVGPQARRAGIFGGSQQRGGFLGGSGRGVSLALGSPPLWTPSALSGAETDGNSQILRRQPSFIAEERQGSYKEDTLWA